MIAFPHPAGLVDLPRRWARALLASCLLLLIAAWLLPPQRALVAAFAIGIGIAVLRFPVIGLALFAFSVSWLSGTSLPVGGSAGSPTELLAALLAVPTAIRVAQQPRQVWNAAPWLPASLLFIGAIMLSASQASDIHAAANEIIKWMEMAVVYVAGCIFIRTRRQMLWVAVAVVLAGLSQTLDGFAQTALQIGPAAFAKEHLALRAYGTFDQPNPYGGFLNLCFPLALGLAFLPRPSRTRLGARWLAAALAIGVLLSESKGAILAGLCAVAVMVAVRFPASRRWFGVGVVVGLAVTLLALFGLVPESPFDRVLSAVGLANVSFNDVSDANFSAVERAAHWLAGVRMFAAHPLLGVGIGNYGAAYPLYHPRGWYASLDHAHNYYINIAAEAGIVGLVTYLLMVGSGLWYVAASVRISRDDLGRAVALGVLGSLVAMNLHNIFDVLYVHGMAALLGLLVALATSASSFGRLAPLEEHSTGSG